MQALDFYRKKTSDYGVDRSFFIKSPGQEVVDFFCGNSPHRSFVGHNHPGGLALQFRNGINDSLGARMSPRYSRWAFTFGTSPTRRPRLADDVEILQVHPGFRFIQQHQTGILGHKL